MPVSRKRKPKITYLRPEQSIFREGARISKPAADPSTLIKAFLMVITLIQQENMKYGRDAAIPLQMTLGHTLSLLLKEGFRQFGIPIEYNAWLDDPTRDQSEFLPLLGRCWIEPGYPEKTGAIWPPAKMNEFEARLWPEQIYALKQHALTMEDRDAAHTCIDLAVFLEDCYRKRMEVGLQRKMPVQPH